MAKYACKGTTHEIEIASVMTPIAQVISIDFQGNEVETFKATALDSGVGHEYQQTGYTEGGTVQEELFYDSALAPHQAITDVLATPADTDHQVTFTNSGVATFTAAGVTWGVKVAMNDGLKATASWKVDGLVGWPT